MGGGSKKQTVGYKYYVGGQLVACMGPVDFVSRLTVDDRVAWEGRSTGGRITVNAPDLFGGEKREGGVSGEIDIEMGRPTQLKNDYLLSKIGAAIPAYRGVVQLVFRHFYMGNNPYLKPWRLRACRIYTRQNGISQWYPAKAGIPDAGTTFRSPVLAMNRPATDMFGPWPALTFQIPGPNLTLLQRPAAAASGGQLLYDSFSPWAYEGQFGVVDTWRNDFMVFGGDRDANPTNGEGFELITAPINNSTDPNDPLTPYSNTPAQSLAKLQATLPRSFNSHAKYAIMTISDSAWFDNRGGLSLLYQYDQEGDAFDMNPAHLIRECLTDPDWGMGYTDDDIDDASFTAAADRLYDEKLGMSLLWDKQATLESFISDVVRHIDAALYVARSTGKFVLKLTRDDYDPNDLLILDESNIDKIESPSRPAFGELVNSVTVNFWNRTTGKADSVTVQDPAGVQMQGAVINTLVTYSGFTLGTVAERAAQRDLRALSNPFLSCTIYTGEAARDLEIGDTFKLRWAKWQLHDVVMRVTGFAMSDGKSSQIRITCVEDVFSTPETAVVVPNAGTGWVDPTTPAEAALVTDAFEVPYIERVQLLGQAYTDEQLAADPGNGFVGAAAVRSSGSILNAQLWTDAGGGYEVSNTMDFSPGGTLAEAVLETATVIKVANPVDLDLITVGSHGQLGTDAGMELVRVDAVDLTTGELTVGRGVLDTVPHRHAAGSKVLFWDAYGGVDETEYASGEIVGVKVQPVGGGTSVPLDSIPAELVTLDSRAARPYPPGNLRIEGQSYPADAYFNGDLTVSWAHRDRLLQTSGQLADYTAGDIGPEAGTTYRVRLYLNDALDFEQDDIAGTSFDLTPTAEGDAVLQVHSKRDGLYSMQGAEVRFTYLNTSARMTDSGEARLTETGDLRVTED